MRIGCLQFAPQVGDVNNNLNRADSVLSKANPDDLDLLVLPELAFSGYNFKSLQDIAPFLEYSGSGITSLWARTVALKYNCVVTVGYPEKVDLSAHWPANPEYYNSTIVVNSEGETIANYRKYFLYYTDESWALEGDEGFFEGYITGLGNTSIGICMDLNPYKYEAPWDAFEFAFHVLEAGSNLVIVSMAWMTREEPRKFTRMPNEPDIETLTYWVTRLEPLIRQDTREEIIVVFCNRCGNEEEVLYAGTSAVVGIVDGEVRVYGLLGRGERELLVVDTNDKPYAKLVQRPETGRSAIIEVRGKPREQEQQDGDNNTAEQKTTEPAAHTEQHGSTQLPEAHESRSFASSQPKVAAHPINRELPLRSRLYQAPPSEQIQTSTAKLPQQLNLQKYHSLRSPGIEGFSVPTPSAPSPTPQALRPRLIIPESPQSTIHQSPQGSPPTATSLRSDRSIQSIDSAMSGASARTVTSNHRPPEESTPYPDSAIPTAHPSSFSRLRSQLHGNDFTLPKIDNYPSPESELDSMSETARWLWNPPETIIATPASASWVQETPIGKKPGAFPWTNIKAEPRPQSTDVVRNGSKLAAFVHNSRGIDSQTPMSNTSSNLTNGTIISDSSLISQKGIKSEYGKTVSSVTTSRQSERSSYSKTHEQVRSSNEYHESSGKEVSQQPRTRRSSSRVSCADEYYRESPIGHSIDERLTTKSRSRSRHTHQKSTDSNLDGIMIPIIASPSILSNSEKGKHGSMSPSGNDQRRGSIASPSQSSGRIGRYRHGSATTDAASIPSSSRAASRGRPPGPRAFPQNKQSREAFKSPLRSPSTDSTRNEVLHSRIQQFEPRGQSRSSHNSTRHQSRHRSRGGDNFERFEAIVCPTCPVHGRSSSNGAQSVPMRLTVDSLPQRGHSADPPRFSNGAHPEQEIFQSAQGLDGLEMLRRYQEDQSECILTPASNFSEVFEQSDRSSSAATWDTSSPERSPSTPSFFNPAQTPRAMVFATDDSDIEAMPNGGLSGDAVTGKASAATEQPHPTVASSSELL
ncbi:n-terminal amidase [Fusarium napiforme]|uniref:N-terminal amidase n=1 Tax=Fusarium napiforme TaxID=42672 RepID=A0A8H5JR53_9HYPO|nr:n-terminal amidase [Fusarium napiforme]